MSDWSIEKKGFDTIQVTFSQVTNLSAFTPAMQEALKVMQQEASRFPPQPDRMRSGHLNTWEREVGQWTASHFRGVLVRFKKRAAGGRIIRVSEKLLRKWKEAQRVVTVSAGMITGRIVNPTTYGGWVQGEQQSRWHAETGWKTTSQIEQEQAGRIQKVFEAAFQQIVNRLNG